MTEQVPDQPDDLDALEAYCMTCKQKTIIDQPEAIWTRRGTPGTRGVCATCGTVVFRMGQTPAHEGLRRPEPVHIGAPGRGKRGRQGPPAVYVNYCAADADFAEALAANLNRMGVATWLAEGEEGDVSWATGVHPALAECGKMVVVWSPRADQTPRVAEGWTFFLKQRKPVLVAVYEAAPVPDALRSRPRFDFSGTDTARPFRALLQALAE